jgi:hypothetical protein
VIISKQRALPAGFDLSKLAVNQESDSRRHLVVLVATEEEQSDSDGSHQNQWASESLLIHTSEEYLEALAGCPAFRSRGHQKSLSAAFSMGVPPTAKSALPDLCMPTQNP